METNQPTDNLNGGKRPPSKLSLLLLVGGVVVVIAIIGFYAFSYVSNYQNKSPLTASLQGTQKNSQTGADAVREGKRLTIESVKAHAAYQQAGAKAKSQALATLQSIVRQRKVQMTVLAEENPQEFLKLVLPREIRNTIPTGLSDDIESEVVVEGILQIIHEDYFETEKSKLSYYLDSRNGQFLLSSPKQFPRAIGGVAVMISGFKIGQTIVLPTTEKNNFEFLEELPSELPFQSSIKHKFLSFVRNVLGTHVAQASHTSLATAQKVLVILINFTDDTSQPFTPAQAASFVNGSVNSYFTENSYGKMPILADAVGWYTVPLTSSCQSFITYINEAIKAANPYVYFPNYSHILLSYPGTCGYAGVALIGHSMWSTADGSIVLSAAGVKSLYFQDLRVNGHELSHSILGQYHANARDCGTKVTGSDAECTNIEYGDKFDILGAYAPSPSSPYHLSGRHKPLAWFGTGEHTQITTDGTYTLNPFESLSSANKVYYVWKTPTSEIPYFPPIYLEFRQPIGFDAGIPLNVREGLLTRISKSAGTGDVQALDNTPETTSWLDPALEVGKTLVDFFSGVTIKVLSKTTSALTFIVTFPATTCIQANPAVSISPTSQWGSPGTLLSYSVSVTNNDNSLCASSTFNLASSVLPGWSTALSVSSLLLTPGASGSATITVTSPTTAGDGFYDFSVTATNSANSSLVGSGSATYVVSTADTTPPSVTVTSPLNGSSVTRRSTVTISATAMDNVGVSRVEFYVNGSLKCTDAIATYTCNWNVPSPSGRSYTLQAKAYDAVGNIGTSSIVTVTAR